MSLSAFTPDTELTIGLLEALIHAASTRGVSLERIGHFIQGNRSATWLGRRTRVHANHQRPEVTLLAAAVLAFLRTWRRDRVRIIERTVTMQCSYPEYS